MSRISDITEPDIWVVTGGIATGKSTAIRVLRETMPAAAFFDADQVVGELFTTGEVVAAVQDAFGSKILSEPEGPVNRALLRDLVLGDSENRLILEAILHPRVRAAYEERLAQCRRDGERLLIADIPLFFETGNIYGADVVIVVAVSEATQRKRLRKRSDWPDSAIEGALAAQWPILQKVALADVVWWNEGPEEVLTRQIQRWLQRWELSKSIRA